MSQQDNFSSGFFLGTILGGIVGGAVGVVLASRSLNSETDEPSLLQPDRADAKNGKAKKRPLRGASGQNIELARRSLEDKIAQLNDAIDDVRQQLGNVNSNPPEAQRIDSLPEES